MPIEIALHHLEQATTHLREAAASLYRESPEITAVLWQIAESLNDLDPDHPMLTLDLPSNVVLEVGCVTRQTFEGPLWLTIIVPSRSE